MSEKIKNSLLELNKYFQTDRDEIIAIKKILAVSQVEVGGGLLFELFPDGSNTYFGIFIAQDKKVYEFDVDVDNPLDSTLKDISTEFFNVKSVSKSVRQKRDIALALFETRSIL